MISFVHSGNVVANEEMFDISAILQFVCQINQVNLCSSYCVFALTRAQGSSLLRASLSEADDTQPTNKGL